MILSDEGKVFACICIALFIFIITALLLGEELNGFKNEKHIAFFYAVAYLESGYILDTLVQ